MLRFQLKNIILTPATAVAILGLYLFMMISVYPALSSDMVYNYQYATQLGYGSYFIPIATVLPICFFLRYCGTQTGAQFFLIRSHLSTYTSRTITCAALSGMAITLGTFILFSISCYLLGGPEGTAYFGDGLIGKSYASGFYDKFLEEPFSLYMIMGAIYTLNGAMWPIISLFCFSLCQNQYIVVAIPFLLKIAAGFFAQMAGLFFLDPGQLKLFGGVSASYFGGGIPYMLCYMGIVILFCGGGWAFRVYRRIRHA